MDEQLRKRIDDLIQDDKVVLFMKGSRHFPQCGFSATVAQILDGLISEYKTINVLADGDIREGIKQYSNWPTIPQLYVGGEFVGGCDIVREMYLAGELHSVLGVEDQQQAPKVELTDAARKAVQEALGEEADAGLRIEIGPRFEYALSVDGAKSGDFEIDAGGVTLRIDRSSAARADGMRIDYSDVERGGFRIENPNEPPRVRQMSVQELSRLQRDGQPLLLVDVRPEGERQLASLPTAVALDAGGESAISEADKNTPLVFLCHHGHRSQTAAERYLQLGHTQVYNLAGGIDAWSREVDSSVPRY